MIGIFLDDERNPEDVSWIQYPKDIEWYVVRRMADFLFCIYNLEETLNLLISFDHDIQDHNILGNEVTGYDCLKAMTDLYLAEGKALPICYFHTQNPIGKGNMIAYYKNAIKFQGE